MAFRNPFGKNNNPEFYVMSCPKCGWGEALELDPCEMDVVSLSDDAPMGPRRVTALPKRCPECGARLNKARIPVVVKN